MNSTPLVEANGGILRVVVLLLVLFCSPALSIAQLNPEPPPLVRFTGSFLPLSETEPPRLSTLTVSIKETKWRFHIAKVEKLSGRDPSGTRLLESIFPPHLRLTGPGHLLSRLQDLQVEGKSLTLEGRLYVGERMFLLLTITEGSPVQK